MSKDDNGYHLVIDECQPVRDALYNIAKDLDHLPPEKHPYAAVLVLCYAHDDENSSFFPYKIGELDDESLTRLLISTLHEHSCGGS